MEERRTSRWRTAWHWIREIGPWVLIAALAVYLVWTTYPSIDLSAEPRPVPDFSAPTLRGEPFRLSAHRGQVLVLNVWATWCPPCRLEMPGLSKLQRQFRERDVLVVGLNVNEDGLEAARSFVEESNITYPQIDGRRIAYQHFPGDAIPRTYLVDRQGRIRFEHTGFIVPSALESGIEALLAEPAP
jgi:peroxiredoxin